MALKYFVVDTVTGRKQLVSASVVFQKEIPTGDVDGSNLVFTLSNNPADENSVNVFVDGLIQLPTKYTVDVLNKLITFGAGLAPRLGQDIFATYVK